MRQLFVAFDLFVFCIPSLDHYIYPLWKKTNFFTTLFPFFFFAGCIWGDPHIVTLDGGSYSFNGFGEYIMVQIDEMDFGLHGRTDFAMVNDTIQESGGTVYIAFAAKMGSTRVFH